MTDNKQLFFAFTLNNYTDEDIGKLKSFASSECYRMMFGKEEAPTTGTKHLQGCFQLLSRTRPSTVKNKLNIREIHLEIQKKHYIVNAQYCEKSGDVWYWPDKESNFYKGKVITKKDDKYQKAIELAKKGELHLIDSEIYLKYETRLNKIFVENLKTENLLLNNKFGNFFSDFFILIWGPTGTGKSYLIEDVVYCLEHFWKNYCKKNNKKYVPLGSYYKKNNKWFDGYIGQKIVIIEELEPQWVRISGNLLKQLCDQYPFPVECKGTTINKIRPFFVIMTSNYNLKQLCSRDDGTLITENYEPLNRRLYQVQITNFGNFIEWPKFDQLTLYFDTHESVKQERQQEKERRRLQLERLAEERQNKSLSEPNTSLTIESQPSPHFIYSEDFEVKTTEYFDNLLNEYQTQSQNSDNIISINYCELHFDRENIKEWDNLNLYKKIIKGLKQVLNLQNFRITNLQNNICKLKLKISNLNEAYTFINSMNCGESEFFNNSKEKFDSLTDIIIQISEVLEEIENNEREIVHLTNKKYNINLDIDKYNNKIEHIIVQNNKKIKNLVDKINEQINNNMF